MKRLLAALWALLALGCLCAVAEAPDTDETNYHTVTYYDAYFGTACPSTQAKMPSVDLTLSTKVLERFPYIFCGWSEERLADTADYMPGDVFTEDRDMTLYAVWQLAYDAGTVSPGNMYEVPVTAITEQFVYVRFDVSENGRYRFESQAGYFQGSSSADGGTIYSADGTAVSGRGELLGSSWNERYMSIVADLTAGETYYLKYVSTPNPLELSVSEVAYSITYSANGRRSDYIPDTQYKSAGESVQIPTLAPSTHFYASPFTGFIGWAESADATTPSYVPGSVLTEDRDYTLYAVWAPAMDAGTVGESASWPITTRNIDDTTHYVKFTVAEDGWYRFRSINGHQGISGFIYDANGTQVAVGESSYNGTCFDYTILAELEAETTYYLQYCDMSVSFHIEVDHSGLYIIEYDMNGYPENWCSNVPKTQAKTAGTDATLSWRFPTVSTSKDFVSFAGWATSPDATEADYLPEDTYSADESVTLYAVWKEPYGPILLTGPEEITIDTGVLNESPIYIAVMVTEDTRWTFETTGEYLKGYSGCNAGHFYNANGSRLTSGSYIHSDPESHSPVDCSVTVASLSPYTVYYLNLNASFFDITHLPPVTLRITPQYTGDPYSAEDSIPEGTETIEAKAFANTSLNSLLIPASVQSIGSLAFSDCDELTRVVIENPEIVISQDAFSNDGKEFFNILLVGPREGNVFDFCWTNRIPFRRLDD